MIKENIKKDFNLNNNIKFIYNKAADFSKYYEIYYGYVHNNLYFRKSNDVLLDKATYLDGGYLIYENENLIGGVLLTPNQMTDLFIVPPYKSYELLLKSSLEILNTISDSTKTIVINEVPEEYAPYYKKLNIQISERWMWMISPTKKVKHKLAKGYRADELEKFDSDILAELLNNTYRSNTFCEETFTKEDFLENVKNQTSYKISNVEIYNSSRVLVDEKSNDPVAMILIMDDEGLPLITDIVVRPDHRKRGFGKYLIQHSLNALDGIYSSIRLSVNCDNGALKLYEKLGFVNTKALINYEYRL